MQTNITEIPEQNAFILSLKSSYILLILL